MDGKQARCTHQSSPLGLLFFPNGTIPKSRFCGMDVCFTVETGWDNPLGYHDGCLLFSSAYRVFHHVHTPRERIVVPSMLRIPFLLACSPLLFPEDIRKHQYGWILSETIALLFFLLTKNMIVFSMVQMTFATIQIHSAPYFLVLFWTRFTIMAVLWVMQIHPLYT